MVSWEGSNHCSSWREQKRRKDLHIHSISAAEPVATGSPLVILSSEYNMHNCSEARQIPADVQVFPASHASHKSAPCELRTFFWWPPEKTYRPTVVCAVYHYRKCDYFITVHWKSLELTIIISWSFCNVDYRSYFLLEYFSLFQRLPLTVHR